MSIDPLWMNLVLSVLVAIAVYSDVCTRRISNKLIATGMILGIAANMMNFGFKGIIDSGSGFFCGLVLMIVPFFLQILGGGDVKLLMMMGCFLGWKATIEVFVYTALIGFLISLVMMLRSGELKRILYRLYCIFANLLLSRQEPDQSVEAIIKSTIPYAVPIAGGWILFWLWGPVMAFL